MRILFWSEYFLPYIGGIERSGALLLRELHQRGHELMIVTSHHYLSLPDEEFWHGIPLYRFDFSTALAKGELATWSRQQKRLAAIMAAFAPELHHIFGIGPSMVACLQLLKQSPLPLMAGLANVQRHPEQGFAADAVLAKTLTAASWVTAVSHKVLEQAVHNLPAIQSRISVVYNGYPEPELEPAPLSRPARLLLLGRMVQQKGGALALAAFALLHERYPEARLIFVGDGPERATWQEQARALGNAVEFRGWVAPEEVFALLNTVTIVLIPSQWEGLPMVAIEAAFMMRPVIATHIPGMSEVVVDGKTGILVEPEDVASLANAIAHLLDHPEQATAMGMAAREWATLHFTLSRCADEYETLYRRIPSSHHAANTVAAAAPRLDGKTKQENP